MKTLILLRSLPLCLLMALLPAFTFAQFANYFAGKDAGKSNTSGSQNSFIGYQAGYSNTGGYENSFVGYQAGYSNTTGSQNSFVGIEAGYNNNGHRNSFLGYRAGIRNTTGSQNSFIGYESGRLNTTGSNNSFLGVDAGFSNKTGNNNSFLGYEAGYGNQSGHHNNFLGNQAGFSNSTGSYNSFVGTSAGFSNTTASNNTFVGSQAGYSNTTGYANAFVGFQAGYASTTATRNSFFGNSAGNNTTTGSENVFLGRSAGEKNVTGSFSVSLGNYAGPSLPNLQNAIAIGYQASVSTSNSLVLGSINGVNGAIADTKVGIKTTAPAYNLHVNGSAAKPGGGSWIVASDERLKQDISPFNDGLAILQRIKPVWFRYNGKAGMPTDKKYVGVIAQDMQQIAPYMVGEFVYQDSTGKQENYLDYDANALTYMLVNTVKEQQQQLEAKDARITALEARLTRIEQLMLAQQPNASAVEGNAAQLWQNEPNPTDGSTVIRYRLPQAAVNAQIKLFSMGGQELQSFELTERGEGRLTFPLGSLASGTYVYRLLVDGKAVDAKKLVLVR